MKAEGQQWEDRTVSFVAANVLGVAVALPLVALTVIPFGLLHDFRAAGSGAGWPLRNGLAFLAVFVLSIFVHEGLHALGWVVFGGISWADIEFGVKSATPYTHAVAPMEARGYRLGGALPTLVLGVVPGLLSWVTGSVALMLYGALMLVTSAGDVIVLWLIKDVPASQLVRDHPSKVGCQVEVPA
jgi:hypothetical protein